MLAFGYFGNKVSFEISDVQKILKLINSDDVSNETIIGYLATKDGPEFWFVNKELAKEKYFMVCEIN